MLSRKEIIWVSKTNMTRAITTDKLTMVGGGGAEADANSLVPSDLNISRTMSGPKINYVKIVILICCTNH